MWLAEPTGNSVSTIPDLMAASARNFPVADAIAAPGRVSMTFVPLQNQQRNRTTFALHEGGVGHHDRVASLLPNGPEPVTAFLGVAATAACTPLNPVYRTAEFKFELADFQAQALVIAHDRDSPARDAATTTGIAIIEIAKRLSQSEESTLTSEAT